MTRPVLPGDDELTPERRDEIIAAIVERAARAGLLTPAMIMVEAHRPFSFIGSQAIHFFSPVAGAIFDPRLINEIAVLLEDRGNVDLLIDRFQERMEQERARPRPKPQYPPGWRGILARLVGFWPRSGGKEDNAS